MKPLIILAGFVDVEGRTRQNAEQMIYEFNDKFNNIQNDNYQISIVWIGAEKYDLKCVSIIFFKGFFTYVKCYGENP